MVEVMATVDGVSLSGTGPSFTAVGDESTLEAIRSRWDDRPGMTRLTTTQTAGATILD